jgi:hypothetical protein
VAEFLRVGALGPNATNPAADPVWADGVILANGRNFPDALAAAPLAWSSGFPILLTESGSIPAATAGWHVANSDTLQRVWAVGGTAVVAGGVLSGAVGAATAVRPVVTSATVAFGPTQARINLDNTVTLTATTALPGAVGNDWKVTLVQQTAVPFSVVISEATKTITVTANFANLLATSFIADWNFQGGNAYFTATSFGPGADFDAESEGTYATVAGTDITTTGSVVGGTAVTVSATVSRSVADVTASAFNIWTGPSTTDSPLRSIPQYTSFTKSTDGLTLTFVYSTADSKEVPQVGTHTLRIGANAMNLSATPYANAKKAVINPSQQLVLTAPS